MAFVKVVDAPTTPGVYFLLDARRELLYVGKAGNLRRRLADHVRSGRWDAVVDVRWEHHATETSALAREADLLLALRPPYNKSHIDEFFTFVRVTPKGLSLSKHEGAYGCFPQLGTGAASATGRACIDGFNALARIAPRVEAKSLHVFLSGQRNRLVVDLDGEQPHIAHGVRKDVALAARFFDAGPKAMRALRLRNGGRGIVTREMFVEWIADEVRELIG